MSIEQVIGAYETALNANDPGTILDLYGADPVFMPQGAPALVGRAAVRAGYDHVFETLKLKVRFTVHELEEAGDCGFSLHAAARCGADDGKVLATVPLPHPPGAGRRAGAMQRGRAVVLTLKTPVATALRAS